MDQQPELPIRRPLTPPRSTKNGGNGNAAAADAATDEDNEGSLEEEMDFINKTYGDNGSSNNNSISPAAAATSDEEDDKHDKNPTNVTSVAFATSPVSVPIPIHKQQQQQQQTTNSTSLCGQKYDYNPTRKPRRSSLKPPNNSNNNKSRNTRRSPNTPPTHRGVSRVKSTDGTNDTRRGSLGTVHNVRMRGSIYPVSRRRSIEFEETVKIQEVERMTELNDGNSRELWLQADEVIAMRARRHYLLKKYKKREEEKNEESKRLLKQEQRAKTQHKMKNILHNMTMTMANKNKTIFNAVVNSKSGNNNATSERRSLSPKGRGVGVATATGGNNKAGRRISWSSMSIKKPTNNNDDKDNQSLSPLQKRLSTSWTATLKNPLDSLSLSSLKCPPPLSSAAENTSRKSSSTFSSSSSNISSSGGSGSFSLSGSGSDADSFRGLEKYIDRSGRKQKNMVWDTVLIEQDEQEQFGYYDDEKIAKLYQNVQKQHNGQQKVLDRANQDRVFANDYLMTPRTMKLVKKSTQLQMAMTNNSRNMINDLCLNNDSVSSIQHDVTEEEEEEQQQEQQKISSGDDNNNVDVDVYADADATNSILVESGKEQKPAPKDSGNHRKASRRLSC